MNDSPQPVDDTERVGVSLRMMDIIVALLLLVFGIVVVYDSYRLGSKWGSDGPQSGYFPFYIGMLICIASLATLVQAVRARKLSYVLFVSLSKLKLVLTVLIPALFYVFCVQYVGLYVASAVYIALFMVWLGKYSWLKSILVGVLVNVSFFLMFEVWFKVPLWKGDLDPLRILGY
jgi:Tripartite tricarboxylate transporter TctB family